MPRPARFDEEQIVSATARVAAELGPADTTIARIASALGAPTGSIYHRFASRDVLLGEVWLRAAQSFQDGFARHLVGSDARAAGLAAALHVPAYARQQPEQARLLLLHRREDFLERGWPEDMQARAQALRRQLEEGLRDMCLRLFGRVDPQAMRITSYALAEAPLAAVRRHVEAQQPPPPVVDALIEATWHASLALGERAQ
jgi:AcrR family transcriptional regulator